MQPTRPRHPDLGPPRGPDRPNFCPHCGVRAVDAAVCPSCGQEYVDRRLGAVVGGKYSIEVLLGRGGFGRVYRGTHMALGSPVAVKFLLSEWSTRPDLRVRFRREVTALTRLHHPNSIVVHDFGEDEGELYMVMEYVRGRPLSSALVAAQLEGEPLPIARVGAILDQVLQVIETAHAHGIIHRDLKPDNVMLVETPDGADHVKVLDFGLALMAEQPGEQRLTATQAVAGTPIYMSPEQCRGRDVGPATDVYAIGVMLYEMLAGATPFSADNSADLLVQHMYVDPPPMASRGFGRTPPPSLDALARRALAKKPEDRPTARELRVALGEAVRGEDALTRAAQSVDQRIAAEGLPRELRGLPPASRTEMTTTPEQRAPGGDGDEPFVLLWCAGERGGPLGTALAVNGIASSPWREAGPPAEAMWKGRAIKAAVVQAEPGAEERVRALRAQAATAKLPVLVVDVAGAEATALYIRAGASDVLLAGAGDDALCKKLWRLIRRGR